MQVRFSSVDESYIKTMVRQGHYATENELVRDAVRRMREQREQNALFLAAIQLGEEQITRNETVAYTDDLLKILTERALQRAVNNELPNPDVTP